MSGKALMRWVLAAALLSIQLQAGEKGMEVRDSLGVRTISDVQFSPLGDSVYYTLREWQEKENRRVSHIYRVPTAGGASIQLTRGERGESRPAVSPDGRYLAFVASRAKEEGEGSRGQVWLLPLTGGEAFELTNGKGGVSSYAWSPDSQSIAYVSRDLPEDEEERQKRKKDKFDAVVVDRDVTWSHLWVIDLESRESKRLTQGEFNANDPQYSPSGDSIAFQANYNPDQASEWKHIDDNPQTDIYRVAAAGGEAENLTAGPGRADSPRWSPDGRWLAYNRSPREDNEGRPDLVLLEIESGSLRNLTEGWSDPMRGESLWSSDSRTLYFTMENGLYTQIHGLPAAGGEATQISTGHGLDGGSLSLSPDGQWLAYEKNDPSSPPDIFISRIDGRQETRLTHVNPQADDFAIAESRAIRWKAEDGQQIEGVLILPLGYQQGRRYPLILQIHGGPTSRFTHSFNSRDSQVWAARGFALLQPNPRGSTGYGQAFSVANRGDWGGKDFHLDDLSGVDAVIEMGVADPERLLVMGGSYGGFSTFWAITQTDRFKAAIGHAAISDWYSFYGQTDIPQYLKWGFEGHAWENPDTYRRFSPIEYVRNVKTPLMITHGEEDHRVHIAQAEQYYTALKKLGVQVEFIRYPREGHGIQEPNHMIDLAARQQAWFDRHLGIERQEKPPVEEPQ